MVGADILPLLRDTIAGLRRKCRLSTPFAKVEPSALIRCYLCLYQMQAFKNIELLIQRREGSEAGIRVLAYLRKGNEERGWACGSVQCADQNSIEDSENRQAQIQHRARSTSKIVASRSTEYTRTNFFIDCQKQKAGQRKVAGTSHEC